MTDPELIMASVRCGLRGYHVLSGVSTNTTDKKKVLWDNFCTDCHEPLGGDSPERDGFGPRCIGPGGVCIERVGEPEGTVCHFPSCPENRAHEHVP